MWPLWKSQLTPETENLPVAGIPTMVPCPYFSSSRGIMGPSLLAGPSWPLLPGWSFLVGDWDLLLAGPSRGVYPVPRHHGVHSQSIDHGNRDRKLKTLLRTWPAATKNSTEMRFFSNNFRFGHNSISGRYCIVFKPDYWL